MAVKNKNKASILATYFLVILFSGLALLPFYDKGAIELKINHFHHPILDVFFANITHLGDGLFLIIPIVFFIFHKYCYLILLAVSSLIHLVLVHIAKNGCFMECPGQQNFSRIYPFMKSPVLNSIIGEVFLPDTPPLHLCLLHFFIWFYPKNLKSIGY